jgi:hypothetical protein
MSTKTIFIIAGVAITAAIVGAWIYRTGREDGINGAKKDKPEDGQEPVIDIPKKKYAEVAALAVDPAPQKALPAPVPATVELIAKNEAPTPSRKAPKATSKTEEPTPFKYSDDFRTVVCKGISFALTLYQSMAVKEAWDEFVKGFPEVHQEKLLREVGAANQRRLRDTFKSNPMAFKTLFSPGRGKGTFRLNAA